MGSTGPGGLTSVVGAMMKGVSGVTFTEIPFGGEGPGLTALLGGHVQGIAIGLTAGREHIRAGRVRPLVMISNEPIPGLRIFQRLQAYIRNIRSTFPGVRIMGYG